MNSILRVVLWLVPVVLTIIGPSTLACSTYPPPETVALTWQPLAKISMASELLFRPGFLRVSRPATILRCAI